ncbi:hypothetical protein [Streptomyces sp. NPDC055243]|uniref:hypothetical protein n=1 Tax=Streptomyces sp. NPDC055243 TaxID=3365720 RepID=UPI0037D01D95
MRHRATSNLPIGERDWQVGLVVDPLGAGRCIAFASYVHFPHSKTQTLKMAHRTVCLPDYQGLDIGA